jgi:beta-hydroxylase
MPGDQTWVMFVDTPFPFVRALEAEWEVIRDELARLHADEFIAWPEHSLHDGGWNTFGLFVFGQRQTDNCLRCPRTTALVEAIPGMKMAGFSRLAPGASIQPHRGYDAYARYVLRLHLGLDTNCDCALRVGEEIRAWEAGRVLIFCDATEHEAWNHGNTERTVLLVDFRNPRHRFRPLNPALSAELVAFVEGERWAQLGWRERFAWRMWKLARMGRTPPAADRP